MSETTRPGRAWLTAADLAAAAGVHVRTILREIARGNLAAERAGGWVIDRAEAERWLAGFRPYAALRKEAPPRN